MIWSERNGINQRLPLQIPVLVELLRQTSTVAGKERANTRHRQTPCSDQYASCTAFLSRYRSAGNPYVVASAEVVGLVDVSKRPAQPSQISNLVQPSLPLGQILDVVQPRPFNVALVWCCCPA